MKINRVQRHLLSFGYPMGIVKEYKSNSKYYREEMKDVYDSLVGKRRFSESNRE